MAALRFVSLLLLVIAMVVLATDLTRARLLGDGFWVPMLRHWSDVAPASLAAARAAVQAKAHPLVWDWTIAPLLQLPAWLVFGLLGILAGIVGRRRHRINIFVN